MIGGRDSTYDGNSSPSVLMEKKKGKVFVNEFDGSQHTKTQDHLGCKLAIIKRSHDVKRDAWLCRYKGCQRFGGKSTTTRRDQMVMNHRPIAQISPIYPLTFDQDRIWQYCPVVRQREGSRRRWVPFESPASHTQTKLPVSFRALPYEKHSTCWYTACPSSKSKWPKKTRSACFVRWKLDATSLYSGSNSLHWIEKSERVTFSSYCC